VLAAHTRERHVRANSIVVAQLTVTLASNVRRATTKRVTMLLLLLYEISLPSNGDEKMAYLKRSGIVIVVISGVTVDIA